MYNKSENTNIITDLQKYYNYWQLTVDFPDLPQKPRVSIIAGAGQYSHPRKLCESFKDYSDYEFAFLLNGNLVHSTVTGYVPAELLWDTIVDRLSSFGITVPKESPINSYLY